MRTPAAGSTKGKQFSKHIADHVKLVTLGKPIKGSSKHLGGLKISDKPKENFMLVLVPNQRSGSALGVREFKGDTESPMRNI